MVMKSSNSYVRGSTAYAPERNRENPLTQEEYEKLRRSKVERANRVKLKKNAQKRKSMSVIVGVFVVGLGLIFSEAQVYGIQNQLSKVKKEIVEVNKSNEDLRLQLVKVASIGNVEQIAQQKLHMVRPDRTKIIYADLSIDNFSEIPEDNSVGKFQEFILKIKSLLL